MAVGSLPIASIRLRKSSERTMREIEALRRSTTDFGVPAGAKTANQLSPTMPG